MKKLFILAIMLLLAATGAQAQTQLNAKVTKATVYLQGAALTQTATATLKSGSQEIIINGLSPDIALESLKINAGGVLISSTEFYTDYITPKKENAHITKMKDSLELYKNQRQDAQNDLTANRHLLKLLTEGTLHNMQQTQQTVTVAEITANMELYKAKVGALQKSIDEYESKITELNKNIERLDLQIQQDQTQGRQYQGVLRVSASVPKSITTEFTITYYSSLAAWAPCYDLNIHDMENQVTLQAKAQVQQTTGLDWDNVQLTLSNATPNQTTEAPVFSPWFLRFGHSAPQRLNRLTSNTISYDLEIDADECVTAAAGVATKTPPLLMNDYVDVDMQEVHVNYVISIPYDVPGNGKTQLIDLKNYTINAEYKYYSIPKLSDETYLVATLSGYEQYNLLPGDATVTFNNTFVGKTHINPNVADSLFTVTLATDPRIAVKREKQQQYCETKHVGNSTTVTQSYLITVKNNQTKEVKLTLKEQYPISTNKDIEIRVTEVKPVATYNKTDIGVVTWDINLKAGETRTFSVTYSVKYPKDKVINL